MPYHGGGGGERGGRSVGRTSCPIRDSRADQHGARWESMSSIRRELTDQMRQQPGVATQDPDARVGGGGDGSSGRTDSEVRPTEKVLRLERVHFWFVNSTGAHDRDRSDPPRRMIPWPM